MAQFDYLWEGGPEFAQSSHFKFGTDSVLLGNFANLAGVKKGIDLGCSSGVVALLLLSRSEKVHMTGLEIHEGAARLAEENMAHNGLEERSRIVCGDIRNYKKLFAAGSFDLVVSNPPYFPAGAGKISPYAGRAAARGEVECTLEDLLAAMEYLCRWDGKVALVYRPERLCELFCAMTSHGIEPKRMRMVCHKKHSEPSLVLVEGRRGGKSGLSVGPVLYICEEDGSDSAEIKEIYHRI